MTPGSALTTRETVLRLTPAAAAATSVIRSAGAPHRSLIAARPGSRAPVIIPTTASRLVSFVVSVVIVRPSRSTVIRSETANTSGRLWLIMMIESPWLRTSLISSSTIDDSRTPSAAVGSSMITIRVPHAIARATATACRWPPERLTTGWSTDLIPIFSRAHLLLGAAAHRLRVEEAEPAERAGEVLLATEEEVGRRVEVVGEREVLVDGLDPELARLARVRDRDSGRPSRRSSPPSAR